MTYWCPACEQLSEHYRGWFDPRCEVCDTVLEPEETFDPVIVDFRELDIGEIEEEETVELADDIDPEAGSDSEGDDN